MKARERSWLKEEGGRVFGLGFSSFFSLSSVFFLSSRLSLLRLSSSLSLLGLLGFYIDGEAMRAIG